MLKMQAPNLSRTLSPYERNQLRKYAIPEAVALEMPHMPIEYLTGFADFCGHSFEVTTDSLIPRVETEELVQLALLWLEKNHNHLQGSPTVLDVGTGCGAIILSLALTNQHPAKYIASDISKKALNIALRNAKKFKLDSITWAESNLLDFLDENQPIDVIIANLPYIPTARIAYLDSSVKDFEPILALDGGPDGLTYIRKLLTQAKSHLAPNGEILLEIDYTHRNDLIQEFSQIYQVETWQSPISSCTFARCTLLPGSNIS